MPVRIEETKGESHWQSDQCLQGTKTYLKWTGSGWWFWRVGGFGLSLFKMGRVSLTIKIQTDPGPDYALQSQCP